MSLAEDRDALRTMLRRAAVVSVDDGGSQQTLTLSGLAKDRPRNVVRVQDFGISSNPPVGGEGLIACPGGRSDRAMFFGGAHSQYRPTSLPIGGTILYDAFGQALKFVENNVTLVCGNLTITASGPIVLDGTVFAGSAAGAQPVKLADGSPSTTLMAK